MRNTVASAGGEQETRAPCLGSSLILLRKKMEFLFLKKNLIAFGPSWRTRFDLEVINARSQARVCGPEISTLSRLNLEVASWGERSPFL